MEGSGVTLPRFELLRAAAEGVRLLDIYWPASTRISNLQIYTMHRCLKDNLVNYVGSTACNLGLLSVNEDV